MPNGEDAAVCISAADTSASGAGVPAAAPGAAPPAAAGFVSSLLSGWTSSPAPAPTASVAAAEQNLNAKDAADSAKQIAEAQAAAAAAAKAAPAPADAPKPAPAAASSASAPSAAKPAPAAAPAPTPPAAAPAPAPAVAPSPAVFVPRPGESPVEALRRKLRESKNRVEVVEPTEEAKREEQKLEKGQSRKSVTDAGGGASFLAAAPVEDDEDTLSDAGDEDALGEPNIFFQNARFSGAAPSPDRLPAYQQLPSTIYFFVRVSDSDGQVSLVKPLREGIKEMVHKATALPGHESAGECRRCAPTRAPSAVACGPPA